MAPAPSSSGSRHDPDGPLARIARVGGTLLVAVAAASCGGGRDGPAATASSGEALAANAEIVRVVDGDTVDVVFTGDLEGAASTRVRLIGIDTPEVAHDGRAAECFGDEATAFTTEILRPGTPVHLQRDVEARDDYGRLLAYVFTTDGTFVNVEIVRRGYAVPLRFEPNVTHAAEIAAAARDAQSERIGVWHVCSSSGGGG